MNIQKEFDVQYKKDFYFFSQKNKNTTKIELIFNEMGIPTDNRKLVNRCLISIYASILYILFAISIIPLIMLYTSVEEGMLMFFVIISTLAVSMILIEPIIYIPFLFLPKSKILYFIFNKQIISTDLLNIIKKSFNDEMIKQSMIYHLMNVGDKCGTNYRFKEYLSVFFNEDKRFEEKIRSIDNNMTGKIKELRDAQESWEDKQVLDTVCSENMSKDSLPINKRKRL